MNKQDFIKILQKPVDISAADLKKLEEVAVNFPFCQIAHILIAKGNYDYGSMLAEQKLKKAALYTTNRKNLKTFLLLKEINPSELIPDYEFEQEDTSTTIGESNDRKTTIVDSFLEKFHLNEPEKIPFAEKYNLLGDQEYVNQTDKTESKSPLIDTFLSIAKKEEKKTEIGSNLHRELLENLEKLRALKEGLKGLNNSYKEDEEDFQPSQDFDKNIQHTSKSPSEDPSEGKSSDSELLIGYLDFLKSKKTVLKRDPQKIDQIIDKFIKEDPSIPPLKKSTLEEDLPDLVEKAPTIRKTPVSENFALILEKQGKFSRAIEIYEELSLKFPEKSPYFATRIIELKKQI